MAIDLNPGVRKNEDPGLMEFGNGFSLLSARHLECQMLRRAEWRYWIFPIGNSRKRRTNDEIMIQSLACDFSSVIRAWPENDMAHIQIFG